MFQFVQRLVDTKGATVVSGWMKQKKYDWLNPIVCIKLNGLKGTIININV